MFAKIEITGEIEVVTGLHIGAQNAYSAIGAVDSPVIRDPLTKLPIIPGSSLKGKMRTLLARSRSDKLLLNDCSHDCPEILRLFGSSGTVADKSGGRADEENKESKSEHSRLQFSDCFLKNAEELIKRDVPLTEVKYENTISRATSGATPRQIERVVRGAVFDFRLIYDLDDPERAAKDFEVISEGFRLLHSDYLGGHGSRGSGRIEFKNLKAAEAYGYVAPDLLAECAGKLG
jgi:CRISPR-associated protein Csm3